MTQDQIDNWHSCANALFGAARIAKVPDNLLSEALQSMSHHHAIAALRRYRERPFRGFFLDRYMEHYREQAGTDAADADGRTDGHAAAAARLAAESEYWRQAGERAAMDQRDEAAQFAALPAEHVEAARRRFEELNMARHGERGLRILALDMWHGREPANWSGDNPRWRIKPEQSRRERDAEEREAERERWFRSLMETLSSLRARLGALQLKYGEVVDVG